MNIEYFEKDIQSFWENNFQEELVEIKQLEIEKIKKALAIKIIADVECHVRNGYCLSDAYVKARKTFFISPKALISNLCDSPLSLQKILTEGGVF